MDRSIVLPHIGDELSTATISHKRSSCLDRSCVSKVRVWRKASSKFWIKYYFTEAMRT